MDTKVCCVFLITIFFIYESVADGRNCEYIKIPSASKMYKTCSKLYREGPNRFTGSLSIDERVILSGHLGPGKSLCTSISDRVLYQACLNVVFFDDRMVCTNMQLYSYNEKPKSSRSCASLS